MVYLDASERPVTVVCSSHLAGTWRTWEATEPAGPDKEHPRVYVARGSHALYFNTAEGVHDAVLHQPWAILDFKGRLTFRGQQDAVGTPEPGRAPEPYELKVVPPGAESQPTDDEHRNEQLWNEWWWLQFQGRWGAKDGIVVPSLPGDPRWHNPTIWAKCNCDADSSSWAEVVEAVAGVGVAPA
jgi:hypothetical protein